MIIDNLINVLSTICPDVKRQGSIGEDEKYPDDFFTFFELTSEDHAHYDNTEFGTQGRFNVCYYSVDPERVYSQTLEAIKALKAAGWVISGKGRDVPSDEPTHTGRGFYAQYLTEV